MKQKKTNSRTMDIVRHDSPLGQQQGKLTKLKGLRERLERMIKIPPRADKEETRKPHYSQDKK